MNERGPRQPLTKQERFLLNALSSGMTKPELLEKIQHMVKNPDFELFPQFFGNAMLDKLIIGLLEKGLIRETYTTTDQGKRELSLAREARTLRPLPPYQGPLTPLYEQTVTPRPMLDQRSSVVSSMRPRPELPKPVSLIPSDKPKPTPLTRPVERAEKPKSNRRERLSLQDLAKVRDQFKPE
jgi:DNA-binding PadR family transcriptional regulator